MTTNKTEGKTHIAKESNTLTANEAKKEAPRVTPELKKKPSSIIWVALSSAILLPIILTTAEYVGGYSSSNIIYYKDGDSALREAFMAALATLLLVVTKKSHIFTEKKARTLSVFKTAWPLTVLIILFATLMSLGALFGGGDYHAMANDLIMCIFVGIFEEFLCRGWLLNSIQSRLKDRKNAETLAIFISAACFGLLHYVNCIAGQSFLVTTTQVLNATALGLMFGVIYSSTRNIWSVALLHAVWDFSLYIGQSTTLTSPFYGQATTKDIVVSCIETIILAIGITLISKYLYNKCHGNQKRDKKAVAIIGIIIYLSAFPLAFLYSDDYSQSMVYEKKKLDNSIGYIEYRGDKQDEIYYYGNITNCASELETNCISLTDENSYTIKWNDEEERYYVVDTADNAYEFTTDIKYMHLVTNVNEENIFYYIKDDYRKLYIAKLSSYETVNPTDIINKVENEATEYKLPTIVSIGIAYDGLEDYIYIGTEYGENFYIDQAGDLYHDKEKTAWELALEEAMAEVEGE